MWISKYRYAAQNKLRKLGWKLEFIPLGPWLFKYFGLQSESWLSILSQ